MIVRHRGEAAAVVTAAEADRLEAEATSAGREAVMAGRLCECGCGQPTKPAAQTWSSKPGYPNGIREGEPQRFLLGHSQKGQLHHNWNGGREKNSGYVGIKAPEHPNANRHGYVREHILIAEKALGRLLPVGAKVHHVNGVRDDNRNDNLVICQDESYHQLLHRRMRAFEACGEADWRICSICHIYDDPALLAFRMKRPRGEKSYEVFFHRECYRRDHNERYHRKNGDSF
jgi:hypothetical protein